MEPDDILGRLAELEKRDGELANVLDHLRDALIVSSAIQDRLANTQQQQVEDLNSLREFTVRAAQGLSSLTELLARGQAGHEQRMAEHEQRLAEHEQRMAHIDQTTAEISDKLNALIDIVDQMRRPPQPPPA